MPKFPTVYVCWTCHVIDTGNRACPTCGTDAREKYEVGIALPKELRSIEKGAS